MRLVINEGLRPGGNGHGEVAGAARASRGVPGQNCHRQAGCEGEGWDGPTGDPAGATRRHGIGHDAGRQSRRRRGNRTTDRVEVGQRTTDHRRFAAAATHDGIVPDA